jgi:hypothetical protein
MVGVRNSDAIRSSFVMNDLYTSAVNRRLLRWFRGDPVALPCQAGDHPSTQLVRRRCIYLWMQPCIRSIHATAAIWLPARQGVDQHTLRVRIWFFWLCGRFI